MVYNLTLSRPGGTKVPALTLNNCNFLNIYLPKSCQTLPLYQKCIWKQLGMIGHWVQNSILRWQLYLPKFLFSCLHEQKLTYVHFFTLLARISNFFLLFLSNFNLFLVVFWPFGKIKQSKMAAVWTSWRNCHVMWHHNYTFYISKERFVNVLYTLLVALLLP